MKSTKNFNIHCKIYIIFLIYVFFVYISNIYYIRKKSNNCEIIMIITIIKTTIKKTRIKAIKKLLIALKIEIVKTVVKVK